MGAIKALLPPQNLRLVVKRKTIARCSIASCGFYEQVSLGDLPSRYGMANSCILLLAEDRTVVAVALNPTATGR